MTVFVPASPCLLARKTLFTSIKNWCRLMFAAGFRPTLWLSNLVADKPIHKHTSENWMREDLTIVDMSPTFTNNTWPSMRTDAGPANDGNPPLKMGKWTTDVNALITEISPCFHSDQSWLYRSCFQNLCKNQIFPALGSARAVFQRPWQSVRAACNNWAFLSWLAPFSPLCRPELVIWYVTAETWDA